MDLQALRSRFREVVKKAASNPRPTGWTNKKEEGVSNLLPEIADLRRKSMKLVESQWKRREDLELEKSLLTAEGSNDGNEGCCEPDMMQTTMKESEEKKEEVLFLQADSDRKEEMFIMVVD